MVQCNGGPWFGHVGPSLLGQLAKLWVLLGHRAGPPSAGCRWSCSPIGSQRKGLRNEYRLYSEQASVWREEVVGTNGPLCPPVSTSVLIVSQGPLFPLVSPFSELTELSPKLRLSGTFNIRTPVGQRPLWACSVAMNVEVLQSFCPQLTS